MTPHPPTTAHVFSAILAIFLLTACHAGQAPDTRAASVFPDTEEASAGLIAALAEKEGWCSESRPALKPGSIAITRTRDARGACLQAQAIDSDE